jgi:hypothetical protein
MCASTRSVISWSVSNRDMTGIALVGDGGAKLRDQRARRAEPFASERSSTPERDRKERDCHQNRSDVEEPRKPGHKTVL